MRITGTEPALLSLSGRPWWWRCTMDSSEISCRRALGDCGKTPLRFVARLQPYEVAAFVAAASAPCVGLAAPPSAARRRGLRTPAGSWRCRRCRRAPPRRSRRRRRRARPAEVAEMLGVDRHRIGDAIHLRDDGIHRHHGRVHALLDAAVGALRDAEQLDAIAEFGGGADVGRRDRWRCLRYRCRSGRSWCRRRASSGSTACARYRGPRCRKSDRLRRSPAAGLASDTRRTDSLSCSMRVRM